MSNTPTHRAEPYVWRSFLMDTYLSRAVCTSTEYVDGCAEDDCPRCDPVGYAHEAKHRADVCPV